MLKSLKNIIYHIIIFVLSAAAALSLPYTVKFIANNYLTYWALIENEKTFLIAVEISVAILLILIFNYLGRSWKDRKFSKMAMNAGLVFVTHARGLITRRKVKKLKEQQGLERNVMVIGSTGFGTFVNPDGDLHRVIQNCREAKIMLLNPFGEGAYERSRSIPDPEITPESFKYQIMKSIDFLSGLKTLKKNIRLKLYPDFPLLKLAILGDYICMKYYHAGLNVKEMPEYIFKHAQNYGSLYNTFYQFFLSKWRDPNIPEYDFDTGDLIYRDISGNEIKREQLNELAANVR